MKYRLKDRDLQRKLDDLTDKKFSKSLREGIDPSDYYRIFRIEGIGSISVLLNSDALEEIPEYDPTTWNEWPDVEPPRNKLLRTEILTERIDWDTPEPRGGQSRFKGSGIFDGNEWYFYDATTRKEGETVRFRPWVGPDEEDSK